MKKVLFLFLMCLPMMAGAQEETDSVAKQSKRKIEITTDFNMAGDAVLLAKSTKVSKSDLKPMKWELTNQTVGDANFITLKITNEKTGKMEELKSWKDGVHLMMEIDEKKQAMYTIYDDTFIHCRIIELPLGTSILLFSALRNK